MYSYRCTLNGKGNTRKNFDEPVDVKFDELPTGVEVEERSAKIAKGETTAKFILKASDKAKLVENQEAKVTVSGPDGMKATETFKVTVKEKK